MTTVIRADSADQSSGPSVTTRLLALMFWFALPAIAIVTIISAVGTFAHRINAQPRGIEGTYVASLRSCQGNVCQIAGTFTSDDKFYVVRNVLGDYRWKVGESHRVVLNPYSEIIALPAQWNPVATVVGASGSFLFLVVWAWYVFGMFRKRATRRNPGWRGPRPGR
jgi:hypothetical protein